MLFRTGDKVEVRSDEDGYIGVWYAAEVVHLERASTCVVEYDQLLGDDERGSPLQERVFLRNVRPRPPRLPARAHWLKGDLVEAYDRDGWWAGVVTRTLPDLILVHFRVTGEEIGFPPSSVRGLQSWENGKWTDLTQVGRPEYQFGNAASPDGSSRPPTPPEKRKRGQPSKRKEPLSSTLFPEKVRPEMGTGRTTCKQRDPGYSTILTLPAEALKKNPERRDLGRCELPNREKPPAVKKKAAEEMTHQSTTVSAMAAQKLCSHQPELGSCDIRLGLVAYQLLVEALRLKGPLDWKQERLLSDVRLHLEITSAEHALVLKRIMTSSERRPNMQ